MKSTILSLIIVLMLASCESKDTTVKHREVDFNADWKFLNTDESLDVQGGFDDSDWRSLRLPHDWVVESEFDSSVAYEAKATGYLTGKDYGYYRKTFKHPLQEDELSYILFDGVYNNAEVYINNHKLGFHPYGYSPFYYDLTEHLKKGDQDNSITVKIDHRRYADSRWYTGAGIYRNVKMITTNKLHIPVWGSFVTTPKVSEEKALTKIDLTVNNEFDKEVQFTLKTTIFDANGKEINSVSETASMGGKSQNTFSQHIEISKPKLWGIDTPNLYTAKTEIIRDGEIIDTYDTRYGIRSIEFDVNKGFFLNGENLKIKGVCLHHDGGLVGAAVPKGVWKRRLQVLKDGGCNAIRISHNPGSTELLDLCDEMGILVQDEFFDEWDNPKDKRFNQNESKSTDFISRGYGEHFQEWAKKDLSNVMLSHRNHPSIIQWSIGNEIEWTYPRNAAATGFFNNMNWDGNYFWSPPPYSIEEIKHQLETLPKDKYDIGKTAQKLSKWTKELDTTRPVTANLILPSASHLSGYVDALDIAGYSYRRALYDYGHKNYPDKPIMGTENLGQYHEWKAVAERPFIAGLFIWTGIDYMGEIRDEWPVRVQPSGLLNTAGFPRGSYHMMKTLWKEEPHIHIATQTIEKSLNKVDQNGNIVAKDPDKWQQALWSWQEVNEHWNYDADELVSVELYSNCEEIELFLNDKSLGKKKLSNFEDHIYKWAVPFREGELRAVGTKDGKELTEEIITARKASKIMLSTDLTSINANHYDVAHVIAQLVDEQGNPVKTDDREITFEVQGKAKILGVDNGWSKSVQKFQSNKGMTHNGRLLLIIQAEDQQGAVEIVAKSNELPDATINISIK